MTITALHDYFIECDRKFTGCRVSCQINLAISRENAIERARDIGWVISDGLRKVSCPVCWKELEK